MVTELQEQLLVRGRELDS
jgi:hypothetical protein